MDALLHFLPQVWFVILALFLLLYVMLDGFDLGVGILSLTASSEERRSILMTSLGNVWDANETWLVLMGGALFGAFPLAYATILHALYVPIWVMIFGLIFRAVAFEFREHARRKFQRRRFAQRWQVSQHARGPNGGRVERDINDAPAKTRQ